MKKGEKQQKFVFFFALFTFCKKKEKRIVQFVKNNLKKTEEWEKRFYPVDVCSEKRYN